MKRLNNDLIYPQSFPNSLNQLFLLLKMKQKLIFTKQKSRPVEPALLKC